MNQLIISRLPLIVPVLLLAVLVNGKIRKPVTRFISGARMDGKDWTDATFLQPPTKALHPKAARSWWHWRPGWHRGAIRAGGLALVLALAAGLLLARTATIASAAAALALLAGWCAWRISLGALRWKRACTWDPDHPWKSAGQALAVPWVHYWHYKRPLRYALTEELGVPPGRLRVPFDRSRATVGLPPQFTGGDKKSEAVTRAVTTKLALEAPDPAWKLHGYRPRVTFTLSDPPPRLVTWEDLAAEIRAAKADELLNGVGRRAAVSKVSLELDSPHFGIISGSGGGKSVLAGFWLLQALMRGDIALILDAKRFSHPWAYKDMDAEYGLLPNVGYCRTTSDLHDAMVWLGEELDRRNDVAERTITARGDVLGNVGPRIWIIAEEMNLAMAPLKAHWAAIRDPEYDPKRSPAFSGLGAVSYAGRAARMHLVVIGQMLTAAVLGGGDVRENIGARMLTRYTANSWKMQAGDIPMPPPPKTPGRWQFLVGSDVSEVQAPLIDMGQARELAVSGTVTPCPAGMPGRSGVMSVPGPASSYIAPEQPFVVGQDVEVVAGLTVKEAIAEGIFGPLGLEAARKRVQRAGLEANGQRGDGSYTYDRAQLFAAARNNRQKELTS